MSPPVRKARRLSTENPTPIVHDETIDLVSSDNDDVDENDENDDPRQISADSTTSAPLRKARRLETENPTATVHDETIDLVSSDDKLSRTKTAKKHRKRRARRSQSPLRFDKRAAKKNRCVLSSDEEEDAAVDDSMSADRRTKMTRTVLSSDEEDASDDKSSSSCTSSVETKTRDAEEEAPHEEGASDGDSRNDDNRLSRGHSWRSPRSSTANHNGAP